MINCIPGVQSKLLEQRGCTQQSWASPKLSERGHVTQGPRTLAVSLCLGPGAPEGTVVARGRGGGRGRREAGPLPSSSPGWPVEHWGLRVGQQQVTWLFYQSELLRGPRPTLTRREHTAVERSSAPPGAAAHGRPVTRKAELVLCCGKVCTRPPAPGCEVGGDIKSQSGRPPGGRGCLGNVLSCGFCPPLPLVWEGV